MRGMKLLYMPHNKGDKPLVFHFGIAQSEPSMSGMQSEQLKIQKPLEKQSTSHMRNQCSTIPIRQKTVEGRLLANSGIIQNT